MTNELYFATELIDGINFDIILSVNGVQEILINKKLQLDLPDNATRISSKDLRVNNAFRQLKEYFDRTRKEFDLQLEIIGTDFQKNVWNELTKIPYGETISYGELAERMEIKIKYGL